MHLPINPLIAASDIVTAARFEAVPLALAYFSSPEHVPGAS